MRVTTAFNRLLAFLVPRCATSRSSRRRSPSRSPCAAAGSPARTAPTPAGPATTPHGRLQLAAPGPWPPAAGREGQTAPVDCPSMGCAPGACRSLGSSPASPATSRTWWRGWPPGWTRPRSAGSSGSPGRRSGRSALGWSPTSSTRTGWRRCLRSASTRCPGVRGTATSPWSPTSQRQGRVGRRRQGHRHLRPVLRRAGRRPRRQAHRRLHRHGSGLPESVAKPGHAPNATVCIDPFHVVALASDALDQVRRQVWNQLRAVDPDKAKKFKAPGGCCSSVPSV